MRDLFHYIVSRGEQGTITTSWRTKLETLFFVVTYFYQHHISLCRMSLENCLLFSSCYKFCPTIVTVTTVISRCWDIFYYFFEADYDTFSILQFKNARFFSMINKMVFQSVSAKFSCSVLRESNLHHYQAEVVYLPIRIARKNRLHLKTHPLRQILLLAQSKRLWEGKNMKAQKGRLAGNVISFIYLK